MYYIRYYKHLMVNVKSQDTPNQKLLQSSKKKYT